MGASKRQRTEQLKYDTAMCVWYEDALNASELHNFNKMVASGAIVSRAEEKHLPGKVLSS